MLTDLKTNPELRAIARERLKGNWGKAILATVIYLILTFLINSGSKYEDIGWFVGILTVILSGAWSAGLLSYYLLVTRQEALSIKVLFSQLPRLIPFLVLLVVKTFFTILWLLLLIVPGIIAALRYSQATYVMIDNPEMTANEAINRSKELMKDQKLKYFLLNLSFIGWGILCIFTLGIGLLWLMPYIYTTQASFYDNLNKNTP